MKAILATTMIALLALAGFLIYQYAPEQSAEVAASQAMAPAQAPAEQSAAVAAPTQSEPMPATSPQAVVGQAPAAAAEMDAPSASSDGQIDESQLPQPNTYETASITAMGREIGTMNKVEVIGALDTGADKLVALRKEIEQASLMGASDEVARLKARHAELEAELISLANRGVSLNKAAN